MSNPRKRSLDSDSDDSPEVPKKKLATGNVIPDWVAAVQKSYPALLSSAYFVPPVHKNKTKYMKEEKYGEKGRPASISGCPAEEEMQNDHAEQTVLHCFNYLAKSQIMFVLSNMEFRHFPKGTIECEEQNLLKIWNLSFNDKTDESAEQNGEFDILVLHRHLGILNTEIKSVAFNYGDGEWNEKQMEAVTGKCRDAVKQIDVRKTWIQEYLFELGLTCPLTMSICLPYVPRAKLQTILDMDKYADLKEDLHLSLNVPETADPTLHCLLKDEMPKKLRSWDITPQVGRALKRWWSRVLPSGEEGARMTEETYVHLVAGFCGPATDVRLRTLGDGVSALGEDFTRLVLTPEQVDILKKDDPKVCIMGPPGVGKTIMLIQKALDWMKEGVNVHVVGIDTPAMAAAEMIFTELKESRNKEEERFPGGVFVHHINTVNRRSVFDKLKCVAVTEKIAVLLDESGCIPAEKLMDMLRDLVEAGVNKIWVAGAGSRCKLENTDWTQGELQNPLRTPPSVTREVEKTRWSRMKYVAAKVPLPSDGPKPIHLYHQPGRNEHSDSNIDCFQCGKDIAKFLTEELHIGRPEEKKTSKKKTGKNAPPPPLRFKDVFILTDFVKRSRVKEPKAKKFTEGLKQGGLPVRKVNSGDRQAIKELMGRDRPDEVVLSDVSTVNGLERKVVVWKLWGERGSSEEDFGRLFGVSRCCSQLVFAWHHEKEKESAEGPVSQQSAGQEIS